jgi:hypothetical protein
MSRVDFSRMYTVDHNVKVFDFGAVHPSHLGRLRSQWIAIVTEGDDAGPTLLSQLLASRARSQRYEDFEC